MITRRRLLVITAIFMLTILATVVWRCGWFNSPYEAEAELRVRPKSELELLATGPLATDDRWDIIQELRQLLTSRSVVSAALRQDTIKDHPILRSQPDPEEFVIRHLEIEARRPSAIIVKMSYNGDPQLCSDLVNAIVHSFMSEFVDRDMMQKRSESEILRAHLDKLQDEYRKQAAELEVLRKTLGYSAQSGNGQEKIPRLTIEVAQLTQAADAVYRALIDTQLSEAESDGNWDQGPRLTKLRRIEEQYQTIMADLERKLEQLPVGQGGASFEIDIQEHELDQSRRQIDTLSETLAKADLVRNFSPRIEVISPATMPIARRGWFSRSANTD